MVWDRNVEFIIMLDSDRSCNKDEAQFGEKGPERHVELAEGSTIVQENYELYFPKSLNSIQYGHIVIGLVSCDDRDLFVERVFLLEQGSNRRKLRHIQVKNIPDDGIPNKAALLKVIKHVRGMLRPKSGSKKNSLFFILDFILVKQKYIIKNIIFENLISTGS